jgi:hypothetical protein
LYYRRRAPGSEGSDVGSKERHTMKWPKKVREPEREAAPKPPPGAAGGCPVGPPTPPEALRIEELEERIVPNAIWSD